MQNIRPQTRLSVQGERDPVYLLLVIIIEWDSYVAQVRRTTAKFKLPQLRLVPYASPRYHSSGRRVGLAKGLVRRSARGTKGMRQR